jgi:hypothetical protein
MPTAVTDESRRPRNWNPLGVFVPGDPGPGLSFV